MTFDTFSCSVFIHIEVITKCQQKRKICNRISHIKASLLPRLIQPEFSACSIVLIVQFNPAIFQPAWLHSKSIEQEKSEFTGDLLTLRDFARFSNKTRSYLVQSDRFQLATSTAP